MTTIYDQTTYQMLPRIQAARTLKRTIRNGAFSNWSLGKAQAYRLVSVHYQKNDRDHSFWRSLMRENALQAIRDAKFQMEISR